MPKNNSQEKIFVIRISAKKAYKIIVGIFSAIAILVVVFLIVKANPDSINDTFTDETKIASAEKLEIATTTGQVTLAECYSPNSIWTKEADTVVRDISSLSASDAISKDIYCDDYNCILWTDGVALSSTTAVCIATDSNVYANILWSKTDSGTATYGEEGNSLYGDQIGGTHVSGLIVGDYNTNVGNKNWLNRYHSTGTFPTMAVCKSKGPSWRLPNILELDSIRDQAKGSAPYTRAPNFSGANSGNLSSSESSATEAYMMDNGNGRLGSINKSSNNNFTRIRCVRDY